MALEPESGKTQADAKRLLEKLNNFGANLESMNDMLLTENTTLDEQLSQYKGVIEAEENKCSEEIDGLENKNFILTNLLEKQDHVIADLETKIKESQSKPAGGVCVQEKYVLDPTQQTLILHHELQASRNAFKKLTKGLNAELNKNTRLEQYCKNVKDQNEYLANVIRTLCVNTDKATDNSISHSPINSPVAEGVAGNANIDLERLKAIMAENIADPTLPEEVKSKADTSMNAPHKEEEIELSFASSMGSPLPAKNDLTKSHDRIKCGIPIPMLDLGKVKALEEKAPVAPVANPNPKKPLPETVKPGNAAKALARSFIEPYGYMLRPRVVGGRRRTERSCVRN